MSVVLEVELTPARYRPGDPVRGDVVVLAGGRARELRAALVYREHSPDYTHAAVEVPGPVLHEGDLETGQRFAFSIVLPADALPTQRLAHGQVCWEVAAECDRPGFDVSASALLDDAAAAAAPG